MLEGLRSFFRRTSKVPATRRFDAAGGGVRWQNAPTFGPINSEVAASAHAVRRRAGYYARNNPWLGNGVSGLVNAMVGYGIRPTSRHPDAEVRVAEVIGACDELARVVADRYRETLMDAPGVGAPAYLSGLRLRSFVTVP